MEKNLPIDLPVADKAYNDHVIPFLAKLDDGNVFRSFINTILKIAMYGFLGYGIYLSVMGLFGDNGFFESIKNTEGWQGGAAYIGGPLGSLLSIIVSWIGYSMLRKRIEQLHAMPYESLLNYLYKHLIPKMIIIAGEIIFLLLISISIFQVIAALSGTIIFAPLAELIPMLMSGNPLGDMVTVSSAVGNYDFFMETLTPGVIGIITSFVILMAYYISVEAYKYLIKLVINLINFLPKFAIPLAIRSRSEN